MGLVKTRGTLNYRGTSLAGLRPHRIARLGLGYVPEQRDIFPTLSVRENLLLGMKSRVARFGIADAERLFPFLGERMGVRAGALSGGEQQMLALARTLVGDPTLVIVDEPAEGLAPQVVAQLALCFRAMQERGIAMLLIEQRMTISPSPCDARGGGWATARSSSMAPPRRSRKTSA